MLRWVWALHPSAARTVCPAPLKSWMCLPRWSPSVSYTHLDVYKRQRSILSPTACATPTTARPSAWAQASRAASPAPVLQARSPTTGSCATWTRYSTCPSAMMWQSPVSYTHLDVYRDSHSALSPLPYRVKRRGRPAPLPQLAVSNFRVLKLSLIHI